MSHFDRYRATLKHTALLLGGIACALLSSGMTVRSAVQVDDAAGTAPPQQYTRYARLLRCPICGKYHIQAPDRPKPVVRRPAPRYAPRPRLSPRQISRPQISRETGQLERRAQLDRAERARKAGKLDDAVLALLAVLIKDPNDLPALNAIGLVSFQAGRYEDAEKYLREALAAAKSDRDRDNIRNSLQLTVNKLGTSHFDKGDYAKALPYLEEAFRLSSRADKKAYDVNRVNLALGLDKAAIISPPDKALDLLQRAHQLAPDEKNVRQDYATLLEMYARGAAAGQDYRRAMTLMETAFRAVRRDDENFDTIKSAYASSMAAQAAQSQSRFEREVLLRQVRQLDPAVYAQYEEAMREARGAGEAPARITPPSGPPAGAPAQITPPSGPPAGAPAQITPPSGTPAGAPTPSASATPQQPPTGKPGTVLRELEQAAGSSVEAAGAAGAGEQSKGPAGRVFEVPGGPAIGTRVPPVNGGPVRGQVNWIEPPATLKATPQWQKLARERQSVENDFNKAQAEFNALQKRFAAETNQRRKGEIAIRMIEKDAKVKECDQKLKDISGKEQEMISFHISTSVQPGGGPGQKSGPDQPTTGAPPVAQPGQQK